MENICDFCSVPETSWRYPAKTFIAFDEIEGGGLSVADWAACGDCHAFIEADDRRGLARRSCALLVCAYPGLEAVSREVFDDLLSLHLRFFSNRDGEAILLG